MYKLWICLFIIIFPSGNPIFAQNQSLQIKTFLALSSERFFSLQNNLKSTDKGISNFNIKYDTDNSTSQLVLNYDGYNNLNFDRSYVQYTSGIITFGLGKGDRNWSFSDRTSLILSHNARPIESVYLKMNNRFQNNWMPTKANWSFDVFNGITKGSSNGAKSMLFGARAILSPIEGLDFEVVQTIQWGGVGYSSGISALGTAVFQDSNNGSNSNVNKMAGFGISYTMPSKLNPLRIYGQAVGEDEAGNLPSCYAYLIGFEWANTKIKYPSTVGIEAIDTRIDRTTNGNCGPNTYYNNNIYKYTNYGNTMGTTIDTEGTSFEFFGKSQISQNININFSIKSAVINDNNWSSHRLSSKRQSGLINSLGISWVKNNTSFNGNIFNQGLNLDKASIKKAYGVGFSSSIIF
jgi:hypothetical protein